MNIILLLFVQDIKIWKKVYTKQIFKIYINFEIQKANGEQRSGDK